MTGDLMTPMPYNPDCAAGKHTACAGDAWNFDTDQPTECLCNCHDQKEGRVTDLRARTITRPTQTIPYDQPDTWRNRAACKGLVADRHDDDPFFHPEGERGPERVRRANAAKAICATCPVITACFDDAMRLPERHGTFGGTTQEERAAWRAAQQATRARRDPDATTCTHGHPLTPDTSYVDAGGYLRCRQCKRDQTIRHRTKGAA